MLRWFPTASCPSWWTVLVLCVVPTRSTTIHYKSCVEYRNPKSGKNSSACGEIFVIKNWAWEKFSVQRCYGLKKRLYLIKSGVANSLVISFVSSVTLRPRRFTPRGSRWPDPGGWRSGDPSGGSHYLRYRFESLASWWSREDAETTNAVWSWSSGTNCGFGCWCQELANRRSHRCE